MDKRFFVALLLTALVIAITPVLFPTPPQPAPADVAADSLRGDSAQRATAAGRTDSLAAAPAAAPSTPAAAAPAVAAAPVPDAVAAAGAAPAAIAPETTLVETPLAIYRFSNVGAAPVSVTMREYESLRPGEDGQPVVVGSATEPLLDFSLVEPGDTVPLANVPFQVERVAAAGSAGETLRYTATVNGARVAISYAVVPDSYTVRVRGEVENAPAARFVLIRLPRALRSYEADTLEDQRHLAYAFKPTADDARSIAFDKLDPGERADDLAGRSVSWVAAKSKYFIVGLLTEANDEPFAELSVTGAPRTAKTATTGDASVLERLDGGRFAFELYTGPQEWRRLRALGRDFDQSNPYGGWLQGMVQPFATIVMRILLWMHESLALSYGWVLVVFGVAVRLLLWPLNQKAMRTSLKMQRLQPELQDIQKRYRDDPQRLQQEMMRVYRAHDMTPFSTFSGCLPALIPMPVLIALFFVFQNTIVFRGVSFLWLPDISLHDPYYILPLLVGASAFVVSWIGMRGAPPNPQAKMMAYIFPPMMTILFLKWASGLNLYYAVQNLATIPQQWLLARERIKQGAATQTVVTPARAKS